MCTAKAHSLLCCISSSGLSVFIITRTRTLFVEKVLVQTPTELLSPMPSSFVSVMPGADIPVPVLVFGGHFENEDLTI